MRSWLVAAPLVWLASCNALFGVDELEYDAAEGAGAVGASGGAGTTSTSSGGSGTGGGGGAGDGGAGGSSGGEDCFNGEDDDGDDLVDCADPNCDHLATCVELPPGFDELVSLRVAAKATEPCGPGYGAPVDGGVNPTLPAAECSPCGCGAPTGRSCDEPFSIEYYGNASCSGSASTWNLFLSQPCHWFMVTATHAKAIETMATGGSCDPTTQAQPTGAAPSFEHDARICPANALPGSCESADQICAPVDAACVAAAGEQGCPSSYPVKTVVYTDGFTDDRGCGGCGCGSPSSAACIVTTSFYDDFGCSELDTTWLHQSSCEPWPLLGAHNYTVDSAAPGPSTCPTTGGDPTGAVMVAGPVTVCCPG